MKKILVFLVASMAFFSASAQVKSQPNWRGEIDVNVLFPVTNKGKNYKVDGKTLKDKIGGSVIPQNCFECTDTDFRIQKERISLSDGSWSVSANEFKYYAVDTLEGKSFEYTISPKQYVKEIIDNFNNISYTHNVSFRDTIVNSIEGTYKELGNRLYTSTIIQQSPIEGIFIQAVSNNAAKYQTSSINISNDSINLNSELIKLNGTDLLQLLQQILTRLDQIENTPQ